ncbi:hypothetical protein [Bacillus cereus]|uniref:Uncharacterized protein n=1 Tax=Bacillus cereus TaxID=1396 RepID=A0A2B1KYJ6_BACCE|nr:hypothetical protein [Bacillus cereus]PFN28588.1 hypothetical protein COJ50_04960 [Bacillus cereus]
MNKEKKRLIWHKILGLLDNHCDGCTQVPKYTEILQFINDFKIDLYNIGLGTAKKIQLSWELDDELIKNIKEMDEKKVTIRIMRYDLNKLNGR